MEKRPPLTASLLRLCPSVSFRRALLLTGALLSCSGVGYSELAQVATPVRSAATGPTQPTLSARLIGPVLPTVPVTVPVTAPVLTEPNPAQPIPTQPNPEQPNVVPPDTVAPVPVLPVPVLPVPVLPAPVLPAPVLPAPVPTQPVIPAPVLPVPALPKALPPKALPPTTLPPVTLPRPPVISPPSVAPAAQRNAVRGLWVDGFGVGLKTPAQVASMVDSAQRLGINTLFVQTIRRADCLCSRASVPRVSDRDLLADFDPLDEVIKLAHARHMRVIAWVSVTGAGSANAPSTSPQHVLKQHGPLAGAQSWVNRRADGTYLEGNDIWLDVGNAAASDFMAQSMLSLVKNYAIDGLQFDRIRYPDSGNWGYTSAALFRYHAETGTSGTPLANDQQWIAWKRAQVTALVRRVALQARMLKPHLWISAATITYGAPPTDLLTFQKSRVYTDVVQDWPEWTLSGLIDLNVLMNYKQDLMPNHIAWFDGWNSFALKVAGRADVAAGTALYLNPSDVTRTQVERTLAAGLGWVGYAYRTPTLDVYKNGLSLPLGLEQLSLALLDPAGGDHAGPLSALTSWQSAPPQRYGLLGRLRGVGISGRVVEARSADGKVIGRVTTDGNGYYGFADLPVGVADLRVAGQRWLQTLQKPGVVRVPDLLLRELSPVLSPSGPLGPLPVKPEVLRPAPTQPLPAQPATAKPAHPKPAQIKVKGPAKL